MTHLEAVDWVCRVGYSTQCAVRLHEAVLSTHCVPVTCLVLLLCVSALWVMDAERVRVVGFRLQQNNGIIEMGTMDANN